MKRFPKQLYVNYHEGDARNPGYFDCTDKSMAAIMSAEDEGDERVAVYHLHHILKARTIRRLE